MLSFQRRNVNEVVFAFCYLCRQTEPRNKAAYDWPFVFTTWAEHTNGDWTFYLHNIKKYKEFISYAKDVYTGTFLGFLGILRGLELYTGRWTPEQFQYADHLLRTYYNGRV